MPFGLLCCVRPGVEDVVELDYSHQSLTDVPNEVFAHERTLETLLCQSNRITELPRQLFMCHGLKLLDLSDNELQSIPAAVSSLVHLQQFNLNRNTLGTLPDTMKALKYLKFLDLSVNPLEKLPDAITNLMALQELYLNDTYMEFLPGNFGRLSNLRILELRDNYLMILPKSLSRSTDLLRLDIGQNEFQDFPEVIGRFNKLKELWIDCNSLTNIPEGIKSLENLQHLEASNNMIEELAVEIGYCTKLVDVSLTANCLTQLPDTIGLLSNLTTLKLDNNRLYSLPESIGHLKNLEELMLMCNYLDKLPSSMGLLRNLQYLNLDENMLVTIPPEIGSCIKLSVLSIRSNKLTKIPPEIGHLSNLKVLNLVRNSLNSLPQSLLNCENLVALWLSENQSKPLLHMQSEVDPQTYEQVLTCLLFPQVPLSTNEPKHDSDKTENSDVQSSSRHISFVDLKAPPKIPEKPGQLRRAPTPYPKELRALAKHARNIQKDDTQEVTPPVPSAVIKAAKITPTLQQRFASDNKKDVENENVDKTDSVNHDNRKSVYDNIPNDNNYDKPLDLGYEQDKSYKAIDHSLYPNSNEVNSYTKTQDYNQDQFGPRNIDPYVTRQGIHNSIPPPQPISGRDMEPSNYIQDNSGYRYNVNDAQRNIQRLSMCSQESKPSRAESQSIYGHMPLITNISNYDHIPVKQDPPRLGSNYSTDGIYEGDTYIQAREKIYGQRNYDLYGYNKHGGRNLHSPRIPTVSQVVSNSTTMPNLSNYNTYAGSDVDSHYQITHQACPTSYGVQPASPTYVSTQTPELYSPTGHTNLTNPYRMTNTPLVSDDGSYGHIHPSANMYDVYDTLSTTSRTPSVHNQQGSSTIPQPIYGRGQPPPYHVAAPFTKHAQYFNGTGG